MSFKLALTSRRPTDLALRCLVLAAFTLFGCSWTPSLEFVAGLWPGILRILLRRHANILESQPETEIEANTGIDELDTGISTTQEAASLYAAGIADEPVPTLSKSPVDASQTPSNNRV
ncbi:hypothetical protein K435DRAFT_968320 [Dendrothele bispora CBS 962.96]|uniref:Uncharacterized protein n=1 Tax=Dendrothele bispora (strain CBS 962.96) TaxID=1314807 RepID=A0A4S8LPR6_DENBC|nr:hypothetical protein K435DRAFT_968320 [Dendrothele bispora CBS 962.96]